VAHWYLHGLHAVNSFGSQDASTLGLNIMKKSFVMMKVPKKAFVLSETFPYMYY
jgi:hypothetical protein